MKYLFIAAIKDEIDFSFLDKYSDVCYLYSGIGKVNATISLMTYLNNISKVDLENLHIINVGTCGSNVHKIGDVISIISCKEFGCELVSSTIQLVDISMKLSDNHKKDSIMTSDFFISTQTLSVIHFSEFTVGYNNFDMEIAALAKVCFSKRILLSSIKIVSDNLSSSFSDWSLTLKQLSPSLERIVKSISRINI